MIFQLQQICIKVIRNIISCIPADELQQAVRVHLLLRSLKTIGLKDGLQYHLSSSYLHPQQVLHVMYIRHQFTPTMKRRKQQTRELINTLGGGKVSPGGNLGKFTAGWFCTRAKKASEGSGKTISSQDSTTTGFFVDMELFSSSGYNFK